MTDGHHLGRTKHLADIDFREKATVDIIIRKDEVLSGHYFQKRKEATLTSRRRLYKLNLEMDFMSYLMDFISEGFKDKTNECSSVFRAI